MRADEFSAWIKAMGEIPSEDIEKWLDVGWDAIYQSFGAEQRAHEAYVRAAEHWAGGIAWSAFWLAVGAIAVAAIIKG